MVTAPTHTITHTPAETEALGFNFARERLRPGAVVALYGELGSGKTCFVRGAARALGITNGVLSPTFPIVNAYPAATPVYHIDAYRLKGPDDLLRTGYEDYAGPGSVCFIEWAERVEALLPDQVIRVRFTSPSDTDREIIIEG